MTRTKNKPKTKGISAGVGAGIAAAGAAAALGYYFYASEDAKKHRRIAAKWADNLKRDAVREVKKLKRMDAEDVAQAVDTAVAAYEGVRSIRKEDMQRAAAELKANWKLMRSEAEQKGRAKVRAVGSRARRVVSRKKRG